MVGIIFGIACIAGLIHLNRHHHHGRGGPRSRRQRRFKRRFVRHKVDRALDHLDASDDQAREIHEVVEFLHEELGAHKDALHQSRQDLITRFTADSLDETILAPQREVIDQAQSALERALARVHEILEPDQRAQLGELLGSRLGRAAGPYR